MLMQTQPEAALRLDLLFRVESLLQAAQSAGKQSVQSPSERPVFMANNTLMVMFAAFFAPVLLLEHIFLPKRSTEHLYHFSLATRRSGRSPMFPFSKEMLQRRQSTCMKGHFALISENLSLSFSI